MCLWLLVSVFSVWTDTARAAYRQIFEELVKKERKILPKCKIEELKQKDKHLKFISIQKVRSKMHTDLQRYKRHELKNMYLVRELRF